MPDITDSNGIRESIEATYPEKVALVTDAFKLELEEGNFTLYPAQSASDDNESSVCVLFQAENCDILITGDRSSAGERALMKQIKLPKLELLVAGHHGSHNATSFDLLAATQPQAVVISVDANNPYGHPRQEMLDRVSRFGCEVYRTDLQGTIIFRR
jgi:competence protein ComEC